MNQTTPLPTRVNRACVRCRRNKSRCDSYRPCSLCLRANAQCRNDEFAPNSSKRTNSGTGSSAPSQPESSSGQHKRRRPESSPPEPRPLPNVEPTPTQEPANFEGPSITQSAIPTQEFQDVSGDSAISIARKIHTLQRRSTYDYAVDAIPGANDSPLAQSTLRSAPTASFLTNPLPDKDVMDELLSEYFDSIHWFSLVIVVTKFRTSFDALRSGYATPSEKPFLLLLSTILGLSAWYKAHKVANVDASLRSVWLECSRKMVANAESQILDIMDQRSITAIQTLILLGSYYVYHGRPNLSFSFVGATIKAAQSMGLHQNSTQTSHLDREENKRVWWTIYTWDRFASVNYGRPLGISEKVCNIEQPEDIFEEPMLVNQGTTSQQPSICYSPYQRELNKLYQIASPAIERVYRTDGDQQRRTAKEYHEIVIDVTTKMWQWRRELSHHLRLTVDTDCPAHLEPGDKAYRLQSLSLYLTFDSLILILHRPFMKQRLDSVLAESSPAGMSDHSRAHTTSSIAHQAFAGGNSETSSHDELWDAAVRTTRITELPQLAQHATDGHLINFLTMNLFNAAVVLIVMALSNPLTDKAQEAKRAVARVYRMELALARRSVLSQQSAAVLRSLVQLLISRESDTILAPMTMSGARGTPENGHDPTALDSMTVRDALSLPLWTHFDTEDELGLAQTGQESDAAGRLQHGLESVQRAFAGGTVEAFASRQQSRRQSITAGDQQADDTNLQQESTFTNTDVQLNSQWMSFDPGLDNGMHWIWDPAWDNLFSNVDL